MNQSTYVICVYLCICSREIDIYLSHMYHYTTQYLYMLILTMYVVARNAISTYRDCDFRIHFYSLNTQFNLHSFSLGLSFWKNLWLVAPLVTRLKNSYSYSPITTAKRPLLISSTLDRCLLNAYGSMERAESLNESR